MKRRIFRGLFVLSFFVAVLLSVQVAWSLVLFFIFDDFSPEMSTHVSVLVTIVGAFFGWMSAKAAIEAIERRLDKVGK